MDRGWVVIIMDDDVLARYMVGQNGMYRSQAGGSPADVGASPAFLTPLAPAEEQEDEEVWTAAEEDLGHRKKLRDPSSITFSLGSKPKQ